jgi:hypothetical protein
MCQVRAKDQEGVLPLSDLECDESTPQGRLVEDYTYWFANWPDEMDVLPFRAGSEIPDDMPGAMPEGMAGPSVPLGRLLQWSGLIGAVYGATLLAIADTLEGAQTAMMIGSGVMAGLMGLVGRRYGMIVAAVNQSPRAPVIGTIFGMLFGGVLGVLMGAMAVGFVGTIPGSIIGTIVGGMVSPTGRKPRGKFLGGILGACLGGIILTMTFNREAALSALLVGALVGSVGAIFLILFALFALAFLMGRRN